MSSMGFYPHQVLQDSYEFYTSTGSTSQASLSWSYDSELPFLVDADRGGFQRLLFICLDKYLGIQPAIHFTFQTVQGAGAGLELAIRDKGGFWAAVRDRLVSDPMSSKLADARTFRFEDDALVVRIQGITWEQEAIDFGELIRKYESVEDAKMMLDLFFESADERIEEMGEAFRKGESSLAHRLVHSFKGSALNICAPGLAAVCREIEVRIRTMGMVTVVTEDLHRIRDAFASTKLAWHQWQKETTNAGN